MRHLLDIQSLSQEEISEILGLAENLKEILIRPIPKVPNSERQIGFTFVL